MNGSASGRPTDSERAIDNRLASAPGRPPIASNGTAARTPGKTEFVTQWRSRLEAAMRQRALARGAPEQRVVSVELHPFDPNPQALESGTPNDDMEVAATVVRERQGHGGTQTSAKPNIRQSWEMDVCTFGELMGSPKTEGRMPVATPAMLEHRRTGITRNIISELTNAAARQRQHQTPDDLSSARLGKSEQELVTLVRVAIPAATRVDEVGKIMNDIGALQQLGIADAVTEELLAQARSRLKELENWKGDAYRARPESAVAKGRYVEASARDQALGGDGGQDDLPLTTGLTISQRRAIEDAARQRAKSMAASGTVLVDVEIVIGERAIGALTILPAVDVTIVARYRKSDVRGLSVEWPVTWHVSSIDLLTGLGEPALGP